MNIFGEGLPKEILNQIKQRQKIYGSGYNKLRNENEIVYLNSKTSWCKLISGVNVENINNINNPTIKSIGFKDNKLAKAFILFNGTKGINKSFRSGISSQNSLYGSDLIINDEFGKEGAYGIGGNEFGIRPMMGIQSAFIKHENAGSIRRAEVKIKAFNRAQFEIIDVLYLRLGFTVLLEWGHSMIVLDDGTIETNPVDVSLSDEFTDIDYNYYEFLDLINTQRLNTGGNYDAMLAKVSNFQWSFNPDGSYDITLKLISIGDVIESLKINVLTDSPSSNTSTINVTKEDKNSFDSDISGDIIEAYAYSHIIGNFLYLTKKLIDNSSLANLSSYGVATLSLNPSNASTFSTINSIVSTPGNGIINNFNIKTFEQDMDDVMYVTFDDLGGNWMPGSDDIRYYVRLGSFLKFIQEYIIPWYYNKDSSLSPTLKIDYDENTNLMNVLHLQVSNEPRICYVNRTITTNVVGSGLTSWVFGPLSPKNPFENNTITQAVNKGYKTYANIMNIYLESTFILKTIEDLKDDKGTLSLIDFLQGLLRGVNESLGGVNDLDVFLDETNNTIKVFDRNPLNDLEKVIDAINTNYPNSSIFNNNLPYNPPPSNSDPKFEVYGYNKSLAGFIKGFELKSEIPPGFSTMITAGATAAGSVVGENDTALYKLNKGLKDRYKIGITNDVSPAASPGGSDDYNAKKAEFDRMMYDYWQFWYKLSNGTTASPRIVNADESDVDSFKGVFTSLFEKSLALDKINNLANNKPTTEFTQGSGFIPFNLSLTMDGLSGMKINQQINVDTSYLPSNYPENMRFLIKNLSHEITNNIWTTKLETYCIPKSADTGSTPSLHSSNTSTTSTSTTSTSTTSTSGGTTLRTITSGFPLKSFIFASRAKTNSPKMIMLHHTAGSRNPGPNGAFKTIDDWNRRPPGNRASAHVVIASDGWAEYLFDDQYEAFHAGAGAAIQESSLAIEIQNIGYLNERDGKLYDYVNKVHPFIEASRLYDYNGNVITYRNKKYCLEYLPAQLDSCKKVIQQWSIRWGIPVSWKGKSSFDDLFPGWDTGAIITTDKPKNKVPGLYTHSSCRTGKLDVMPTKLMVEMLKSL